MKSKLQKLYVSTPLFIVVSLLIVSLGWVSETLGAGPVPGLSLIWPVTPENRLNTSQDYAQFNLVVNNKHHTALDIFAAEGTPVRAAAAGFVRRLVMTLGVFGGDNHCMGNVVIINHSGVFTLYAHLQSIIVPDGVFVAQGTQIGTVCRTPTVSRPGCTPPSGGVRQICGQELTSPFFCSIV